MEESEVLENSKVQREEHLSSANNKFGNAGDNLVEDVVDTLKNFKLECGEVALTALGVGHFDGDNDGNDENVNGCHEGETLDSFKDTTNGNDRGDGNIQNDGNVDRLLNGEKLRSSKDSSTENGENIEYVEKNYLSQEEKEAEINNPWKPHCLCENTGVDEAEKKYEVSIRKIRSIFNKMTPSNFKDLAKEFEALNVAADEKLLKFTVDLIVDKAVNEPHFCQLYIEIVKTHVALGGRHDQSCFYKVFISKCQASFHGETDVAVQLEDAKKRFEEESEECEKKSIKEEIEILEEKANNKDYILGTVRLISRVYMAGLVNDTVIDSCSTILNNAYMDTKDEIYLECAIELFSGVTKMYMSKLTGQNLNNSENPTIYFINYLPSLKSFVSNKMKFMIKNFEDFCENDFVKIRNRITFGEVEKVMADNLAVSKAKFYENYKIFLNNLPKEEKAEIKKTMISLDTRIKQFYVTEGERIAKSDYSFEFLALMREVFQFTFPLKKTSKKKKEDLEEEAKIEAQKQEKAQKEYEEWRRREERMKYDKPIGSRPRRNRDNNRSGAWTNPNKPRPFGNHSWKGCKPQKLGGRKPFFDLTQNDMPGNDGTEKLAALDKKGYQGHDKL